MGGEAAQGCTRSLVGATSDQILTGVARIEKSATTRGMTGRGAEKLGMHAFLQTRSSR
jgi:hypothetical protein